MLIILEGADAGLIIFEGGARPRLVELVAALLHILLHLINGVRFVLNEKSITRLASHSFARFNMRSSFTLWFS